MANPAGMAILRPWIAWRLYDGDPPHTPEQGWIAFHAGRIVYYILLAATGLMLVSGPLAGWASGAGIEVFSLHLPGGAAFQPAL